MTVEALPRVKRGEIEIVGAGSAIQLWSLKTSRSLAEVLAPHFFSEFAQQNGMAEHDRILAVLGIGSGALQHADLVVERVVAPVRANPGAQIEAVPAAVHVRPLRWEAPAAKARAA